jgi:hypothetical protein
MRNLLHCWTWKFAFILGLSLVAAKVAPAQAVVTAQRGAEITPFVQTTLLSPDWGPTNNFGYTVGVDYTRFIRSIVQPSLEVRMSSASGSTVSERTYTGGLKLQFVIRRIHPYATLLAGMGDIAFTHPLSANYTGDNSTIYSLGGGAEFNIGPALKARVDFTHQNWNIDPQTLTPVAIGVGISYSIPFHRGIVE